MDAILVIEPTASQDWGVR